jgi:hypothetical protein
MGGTKIVQVVFFSKKNPKNYQGPKSGPKRAKTAL